MERFNRCSVLAGFGPKAQQSMEYLADFYEQQVHCPFKRWLHATSEFTRLKKLALTNAYSKQ